jgi:glycosyltransferase involved in cell wall biosynthesis
MERLMKAVIIMPVFNDWRSATQLIDNIASQKFPSLNSLDILIVDDGSTLAFNINSSQNHTIRQIELLRLTTNLGHQRAIAVGLCHVVEKGEHDLVVVMDSDGEDSPADIPLLISYAAGSTGRSIVAQRARRSESFGFRIGYFFYKTLFRVLTGHEMDFGNFSVIPFTTASRLVNTPELWNHFASSLLRSGVPYTKIATDRGRRFYGSSSMSFTRLVVHGLSALSVLSDQVFVRSMIGLGGFAVIIIAGMIAVISIRFFTSLAIPGWATSAVGLLAVLLIQTLAMMLSVTLLTLSARSHGGRPPKSFWREYINPPETLFQSR